MKHNQTSVAQLVRDNLRLVKIVHPDLSENELALLRELTRNLRLSVLRHELLRVCGGWYITHSGLLRIALHKGCLGIQTSVQESLSRPSTEAWVFKAVVHTRVGTFVAYGDANPSNVSPVVHGAEMRVAETRAVNRALRKAYGIGICSVEELGASVEQVHSVRELTKKPTSTKGTGRNGEPRLRDRLCQLIRHHELDPILVKAYALEFCKTKTLSEATREQIEKFINHLAECAAKDKNALGEQLQMYLRNEEGAA